MKRRVRILIMPAVLITLSLVACGGGGGGATPTATCSPTGTSLQISAKNNTYDKDCLAAPANQPFTIAFDNQDNGTAHNLAIYTDSSANTPLFKGEIIQGPKTTTYRVTPLKPGTYYFRCDVHPTQMFGAFESK
jgi:plastocyanin